MDLVDRMVCVCVCLCTDKLNHSTRNSQVGNNRLTSTRSFACLSWILSFAVHHLHHTVCSSSLSSETLAKKNQHTNINLHQNIFSKTGQPPNIIPRDRLSITISSSSSCSNTQAWLIQWNALFWRTDRIKVWPGKHWKMTMLTTFGKTTSSTHTVSFAASNANRGKRVDQFFFRKKTKQRMKKMQIPLFMEESDTIALTWRQIVGNCKKWRHTIWRRKSTVSEGASVTTTTTTTNYHHQLKWLDKQATTKPLPDTERGCHRLNRKS